MTLPDLHIKQNKNISIICLKTLFRKLFALLLHGWLVLYILYFFSYPLTENCFWFADGREFLILTSSRLTGIIYLRYLLPRLLWNRRTKNNCEKLHIFVFLYLLSVRAFRAAWRLLISLFLERFSLKWQSVNLGFQYRFISWGRV